jgi:hypothetical protein
VATHTGHWRSLSQPTKASFPLAVDSACPYRGIVSPVIVVVVQVIANQPPQMFFVQRDDMVENLAEAASHPAFRSPVFPRCLNTRAFRSEVRRLQEANHSGIEFRVVVEDGITIRTSLGKRFASRSCCTTHSAVG